MSRAQPEQQAPPVQKLRVRYAKRGRMRFTSHRDVSRAVERAVARARIPMAYSSGFHPHPRISYAGASPTGAASNAEYFELGLAQVQSAGDIQDVLDTYLPEGLDVVAVVDAADCAPGSLSDQLTGSRWRIELTDAVGLAEAVAGFLAAESVEVERMTKKGLRTFDCRAAVVRLEANDGALDLLLEHTVPAVRPDDVLSGIARATGWEQPANALLTRLEQGVLDRVGSSIGDPLIAR